MELLLANGNILPETFHFLNVGWWIVHVVGIALVFFIGFAVGKSKAKAKGEPAA